MPELDVILRSAEPGSLNTVITTSKDHDSTRVLAELELLRDRLRSESEHDLLSKIAICQKPLTLKCQCCGAKKEVVQRCKRKWCPSCAKQIASTRVAEMSFIVERMQWPLFVTLTMKNVSDLSSGGVRHLRRSFGKLRHRNVWKYGSRIRAKDARGGVQGGVACVEVTNIGNGWHPHLHCVCDCIWLSGGTQPPRRGSIASDWDAAIKASADEVQRVWSKCLGQETSSVEIQRANRETIAVEVLKYTVKNEDLVLADGHIGDLIRALDSCRLMTTFGQCHGAVVKDIRAQAKAEAGLARAEWRELMSEYDCCGSPFLMPDAMGDATKLFLKDQARRAISNEKRVSEIARSGRAVEYGFHQLTVALPAS